ncbi:hypothetical protein [Nocardioides massiliensis]|uniref:Uncharacterized protein n=1 Tax=Nocardioides massiliensis TaxID=1325935 RepID=A0ABT9NJ01_9ACTN|nr:hypothetical protein [Nocardioides massiliensis]MDP9820393.1 hypothetical protein [Nocardioides massiliensis]
MEHEEPIPLCPECGLEMSTEVLGERVAEPGPHGSLAGEIEIRWVCKEPGCRSNQPGSLGGDNGGG